MTGVFYNEIPITPHNMAQTLLPTTINISVVPELKEISYM
jgi:hypothetical protein